MCNSEMLKSMLLSRLGGADTVGSGGVFSETDAENFLALALARLNRVTPTTVWNIEDPTVLYAFPDVVVGWATVMAWMSKVAVEAGKEFDINDNGVLRTAPEVSQKLIELTRIEGDVFRLSHDKISNAKRALLPNLKFIN
mgnify:CR=1 FL=1